MKPPKPNQTLFEIFMEEEQKIPFEPKKLARTEDPSTSHAAAKQAGELRSLHHRKITDTLETRMPHHGLTAYDIAQFSGLEVAAVFRRLNELQKIGKIYTLGERIGPTGRKCRVWFYWKSS